MDRTAGCPTAFRLSQPPTLNHQPTEIPRFGTQHKPPYIVGAGPQASQRLPYRPVSCYALFQWWLLLSQHPGCLRAPTSFYTELGLGTLAEGLGCFPFDREAYPPQSHSRTLTNRHSEFG